MGNGDVIEYRLLKQDLKSLPEERSVPLLVHSGRTACQAYSAFKFGMIDAVFQPAPLCLCLPEIVDA